MNLCFRRGNYSMFVKRAWTLFKYLCIDNNEVREFVTINSFKPWKEPNKYPDWKYREEYSSRRHDECLNAELKEKQWIAYLDFWHFDCLQLTDGYHDVLIPNLYNIRFHGLATISRAYL